MIKITFFDFTCFLPRNIRSIATTYSAHLVGDLAAHDGQQRADTPDLFLGNSEEITVQHREVGAIAGFERTDVIFPDEPFVGRGRQPQGFLPGDVLIAQNLLTGQVLSA